MTTKKELIEMVDKIAVELFSKQGALQPSWYGEDEEGEIIFIPPPPGDLPHAIILEIVRATFRVKKVVRYVAMFEAFSVIMRTKEEFDNRPPSIADLPGRREILSYMSEDAEGWLAARREIRRPSGELGPLVCNGEGEMLSGRMAGLLPTPDKRRAN